MSGDAGETWQLHTRLGTQYSINNFVVDHADQLYVQVGFTGYQFHLVLAQNGDKMENHITSSRLTLSPTRERSRTMSIDLRNVHMDDASFLYSVYASTCGCDEMARVDWTAEQTGGLFSACNSAPKLSSILKIIRVQNFK